MSETSSILNFWPKMSWLMRFSWEKLKNLVVVAFDAFCNCACKPKTKGIQGINLVSELLM